MFEANWLDPLLLILVIITFSLNWPTGPIQSLSCDVPLLSVLPCVVLRVQWIAKRFRREKLRNGIGLRYSNFGSEKVKK